MLNAIPRPLYSWETDPPGTHCVGGWVGPGAGLDKYWKSRFPTRIRCPDQKNYIKWFIAKIDYSDINVQDSPHHVTSCKGSPQQRSSGCCTASPSTAFTFSFDMKWCLCRVSVRSHSRWNLWSVSLAGTVREARTRVPSSLRFWGNTQCTARCTSCVQLLYTDCALRTSDGRHRDCSFTNWKAVISCCEVIRFCFMLRMLRNCSVFFLNESPPCFCNSFALWWPQWSKHESEFL